MQNELIVSWSVKLPATYHNIMAQPLAQPDPHLLSQQLAGISEQVKLLPNMPAIPGFEAVLANMTQQHNAALAQLAQLADQQAEQHAAALAQQAEQHDAALAQQAKQHAATLAQQAQQQAAQHQQIMDLLNALQASVQQVYRRI